ncbi:MAG: hypothetical protein LBL26_08325 [Peptococcaceae bacterium]|jgi:hypothetical protein|nr:hypothetical protein [Peptococcaceae bacterium]
MQSAEDRILSHVDKLTGGIYTLYQSDPKSQEFSASFFQESLDNLRNLFLPLLEYRNDLLLPTLKEVLLQKAPRRSEADWDAYYQQAVYRILSEWKPGTGGAAEKNAGSGPSGGPATQPAPQPGGSASQPQPPQSDDSQPGPGASQPPTSQPSDPAAPPVPGASQPHDSQPHDPTSHNPQPNSPQTGENGPHPGGPAGGPTPTTAAAPIADDPSAAGAPIAADPAAGGPTTAAADPSSETETPPSAADKDRSLLRRIISLAYPRRSIIENYTVKGQCFDFYIPRMKLAVKYLPASTPTDPSQHGKSRIYCRMSGLRCLFVTPSECADPEKLIRRLTSKTAIPTSSQE